MKTKKEPEYDKAVADKIVNREGTKKSKMQSLKDIGCSTKQIAVLLDINVGNVTNTLNGVYERYTKKKRIPKVIQPLRGLLKAKRPAKESGYVVHPSESARKTFRELAARKDMNYGETLELVIEELAKDKELLYSLAKCS